MQRSRPAHKARPPFFRIFRHVRASSHSMLHLLDEYYGAHANSAAAESPLVSSPGFNTRTRCCCCCCSSRRVSLSLPFPSPSPSLFPLGGAPLVGLLQGRVAKWRWSQDTAWPRGRRGKRRIERDGAPDSRCSCRCCCVQRCGRDAARRLRAFRSTPRARLRRPFFRRAHPPSSGAGGAGCVGIHRSTCPMPRTRRARRRGGVGGRERERGRRERGGVGA